MANSPIVPSDLNPITPGILACDYLRELLRTRENMHDFVEWIVQESGEFTTDFLAALLAQLLYDASKKNWFVRSNPSTGYLELVQYVPLASLDAVGAVDGDTLVLVDGVWVAQSAPTIYLSPTVGGPNPPDPGVGGISTVAHGLGSTPSNFSVFLECTATDCGYDPLDKVDASGLMFRNTVSLEIMIGATIFANDELVGIVFRSGAASSEFQLCNKTTFARANIDITKWNVKFFASL